VPGHQVHEPLPRCGWFADLQCYLFRMVPGLLVQAGVLDSEALYKSEVELMVGDTAASGLSGVLQSVNPGPRSGQRACPWA